MIKILTNADRFAHSDIFDQMFRGRAAVFYDRLGWDVNVRDGLEIDHYDEAGDPVYLVSIGSAGRLAGSLRILPTTGETMLGNEFATFFNEPVDVRSPLAWECTRFCVHPHLSEMPEQGRLVSFELLVGLCELALTSGIEQIVGLYDHAMTRVYRRIGWSPEPLAFSRPEVGKLVVGIWQVSQAAIDEMQARTTELASPGSIRQAA